MRGACTFCPNPRGKSPGRDREAAGTRTERCEAARTGPRTGRYCALGDPAHGAAGAGPTRVRPHPPPPSTPRAHLRPPPACAGGAATAPQAVAPPPRVPASARPLPPCPHPAVGHGLTSGQNHVPRHPPCGCVLQLLQPCGSRCACAGAVAAVWRRLKATPRAAGVAAVYVAFSVAAVAAIAAGRGGKRAFEGVRSRWGRVAAVVAQYCR